MARKAKWNDIYPVSLSVALLLMGGLAAAGDLSLPAEPVPSAETAVASEPSEGSVLCEGLPQGALSSPVAGRDRALPWFSRGELSAL